MIAFYFYNTLSLYNSCIEAVHNNNHMILHFVNIYLKEVSINISYPSTDNQIYGYLDVNISHIYVRYIISIYKQLNNKKNKIKSNKGGDIIRILRKIT